MDEKIRKPVRDPGMLLRVSEHFLSRRHFHDCRKYAQQVYQIDPNFPGVSEILVVADVLLASKHQISTGTLTDWYEVMQLNRYTQDHNLIRQKYNHLYDILNPSNNKFPLAQEAFDCLCDAWYVLSNPLKRVKYDDSLKKLLNDEKPKAISEFAFWTVCPYCYYLYEYPRVYLECCMRCTNEKCAKAFTSVEIDRPPVEFLREGKYLCTGFLPLGLQNGSWNPFTPSIEQKSTVNANEFVEIPDDDDDEVKINASSEGIHEGSGSVKMEVDKLTMKPKLGRKKSVAKTTKKVTGAGNRVPKEVFVNQEMTIHSTENDDGGCENEVDCGNFGGQMNDGDVEFFDVDDDIFVTLQNNDI